MKEQKQLDISFLKLDPNAVLPKHAHEYGDAGFDICSVENVTLPAGEVTMVKTGLVLADCPLVDSDGDTYFLDVRSRSGLATKLVFPVTGTVDVIYRGEIKVVLANFSKQPYDIKQGDRIAQLVIQKIIADSPTFTVVFHETQDVTNTERGASGFGSTGA